MKSKAALEIDTHIDLIADKGYNASSDIANCYTEQMTAHVCMDIDSFDICVETDEEVEKPTSHLNGRCVYLKELWQWRVCSDHALLKPSEWKIPNQQHRMSMHKNRGGASAPA